MGLASGAQADARACYEHVSTHAMNCKRDARNMCAG
jgi:hypothetical protein